jgi:uncharacterized protein involved in outer membrane biogenesis
MLGATLLVSVGIVIAVLRFDPEGLRDALESGLADATGRTWDVVGAVRFAPGLTPAVEFNMLHTPNAAWASEADFIRIGSARFDTGWWGLLTGAPLVSRVRLADVAVNLETDGDGGNNWSLPPTSRTLAVRVPPAIDSIRVERTLVRFRSGWAEAETTYPIESLILEVNGGSMPLALALDARVKGQPLSVGGHLGSPAAMFGGEPFDIALSGRYSGRESNADVVVDGRVGRLTGLEGLDVKFTLKAESLNEVGSISGFELPRDTPVSITAVARNNGAGPQLQDYVLRIGQVILRPQD